MKPFSTILIESPCKSPILISRVKNADFQSGWQDSNLRPPAPKAGAITGLRYIPKKINYKYNNTAYQMKRTKKSALLKKYREAFASLCFTARRCSVTYSSIQKPILAFRNISSGVPGWYEFPPGSGSEKAIYRLLNIFLAKTEISHFVPDNIVLYVALAPNSV